MVGPGARLHAPMQSAGGVATGNMADHITLANLIAGRDRGFNRLER